MYINIYVYIEYNIYIYTRIFVGQTHRFSGSKSKKQVRAKLLIRPEPFAAG